MIRGAVQFKQPVNLLQPHYRPACPRVGSCFQCLLQDLLASGQFGEKPEGIPDVLLDAASLEELIDAKEIPVCNQGADFPALFLIQISRVQKTLDKVGMTYADLKFF